MPYGFLDTKYIDLPTNIDQAYLRGLTTQRGVSFANILTRLDARLSALNSTADPLVADLVRYTTEASIDGTTPTTFALEEENEYGLPRPEVAEVRAAMLPIRRYAKSLGFTEDALEMMTESVIMNQFDSMAATFVRGARIKVLERLTSDAEVRIDRNSTATNPGFAGSGTGGNVFSGTYPDGTATPGGYTHYYRDTAANRAVVIKAARDRLRKWNPGPFDLIASQVEIDAIAALADFRWAESPLILRAQGVEAANVAAEDYVGVYDKNIRVRHALNEFGTSPNIVLFQTFGDFDARNPLAWRWDEAFGRGAVIRSRSLYPLDQAVIRQRFGVGTSNRTAAVNIRIDAAGSYVSPSIA